MKHKDEILRLRSEGKTYNEIQRELGCSKGTISYHLGDGQKEKSNKRSQKRRTDIVEILAKIKEESGCIDCKQKFPYYVLDFDHLGEKISNVSDMVSWFPIDEIMAEVEKCEIICANCHRHRTHMRKVNSKNRIESSVTWGISSNR